MRRWINRTTFPCGCCIILPIVALEKERRRRIIQQPQGNVGRLIHLLMQLLEKVDQPTYVPLWLLNNPAAAFFLQRNDRKDYAATTGERSAVDPPSHAAA